LFWTLSGLSGCAHSGPIGKFKVAPVKLSSTKRKSIAVIISDPDVRDSYDNGKAFTFNGVILQLRSSFTKKLKPNFKEVVFLETDDAKSDAEYFLKVFFEIKDVSSDTKNKCAVDFRLEALASDRKTRIDFKEDSGFEDIWLPSSGKTACKVVMDTLFDGVVDPVLKSLDRAG
jgi:hypothetical protein